jgi:hypothetical protein
LSRLKKTSIIVVVPLAVIALVLVMWFRKHYTGMKQISGEILGQLPFVRPPSIKIPLKLYFESVKTGALEPEEREFSITSNQALSEQDRLSELVILALKGLLAGPDTEGLVATLPKGVTLRGIYFDTAGTAYVDFDSQMVRKHPGGTQAELISIYSVINTLCTNFPRVRRVKFLIEGEDVKTLAGHVDLTHSLSCQKF